MQTKSCSTCELHVTELRAVAENEKLCSKCRWRQEHKCPVKRCTTPASRVKQKNIPARLVQATEVFRGHIFAQFGMPPQLKQCCKSWFTKLHRAIAEFASNYANNNTHTKRQLRKGDPLAVTKLHQEKLKKRIEIRAKELLNETLSNLKDCYNEMTGGCGEELLKTTLQAIDIPRIQTTNEVNIRMQFGKKSNPSRVFLNT